MIHGRQSSRCPFSKEPPLFAVRDFLVLRMETNFPPLLTYLKNSGTSQVGIFCSDILSLFSKKQSVCCIFFFCQNLFLFASFKPWADKKGLRFYSLPCESPPLGGGYEKKKLLFQQKSPDFQKIINTFKNCQRQLYKRIHEHSYIKESLEPGVPISADFQIACEWLDLAPTLHPHPQPASRRFTTMEFMVTLLRLDEHVRVQEPGPLWEFGLSGLVWSGLVWSRWLSKPLKTFPRVRAVIARPQSWNVLWGMGGGRSSSGHTLSYRTLC